MNNLSKAYEGLQIVQTTDVRDLVDECLECKINLLIYGEAGCGKSTIIESMADKYTVVMLGGSSMCEEAMNGIPVYDAQTKRMGYPLPEWLAKVLKAHEENPEKPILIFIDEVNLAMPEVLNSIQILLTDRIIPTRPNDKLPENCVIVCAANAMAETTEGTELSRPLKTRFMTVRMVNTPATFKQYVLSVAEEKLPNLYKKFGEEGFKTFASDTINDFAEHWCDNTEYYGTNPRTIMNFYKSCDYAVKKNDTLTPHEATKRAERCTGHTLSRFNWSDAADAPVRANGKNNLPTEEAILAMNLDDLYQVSKTLATSTRATTAPVIKTMCAISERIKTLEEEKAKLNEGNE